MKLQTFKTRLLEIAEAYLKDHPLSAKDGHVNQDKAEFIKKYVEKTKDKIIIFVTIEQLINSIPEWNSLIQGTVNLFAGSFLPKPLGSTLKMELSNLLTEVKKDFDQEYLKEKYMAIKQICLKDIQNQFNSDVFLTSFRVDSFEYCYQLSNSKIVHTVAREENSPKVA